MKPLIAERRGQLPTPGHWLENPGERPGSVCLRSHTQEQDVALTPPCPPSAMGSSLPRWSPPPLLSPWEEPVHFLVKSGLEGTWAERVCLSLGFRLGSLL